MLSREILDARFPDAVGGLVAGSTARGDDTPSSELKRIGGPLDSGYERHA